MAAASVSYIDKIGEKISGSHVQQLLTGAWGVTAYSSDSSDKTLASSTFVFPSPGDIAKTSVINSITCSHSVSATEANKDRGGYSLNLLVDGTAYPIGSDGKVGSEAISQLNSYKSQNGKFPSIVLKLDSWVSKPPANDDGSIAAAPYGINFGDVSIGITIQGGILILRPCADVSVEHTIQSGFTSVYQLINEVTADDDATKIGNVVTAGGDETLDKDYTSVISLTKVEFSKKNVVLMKPVSRHLIKNPTMSGSGSVGCSIIVGDESAVFSDSTNTGDAYATCDSWSLKATSSLIQAVNSYAKTNKVLPDIQLSLTTNAHSSGSATKGGNPGGAYITQAYLEIVYEDAVGMGVLHKVDGIWKQAQVAYEKRNGVWVEITEEECKSILQSAPLCTKS